MQTGGVFFCSLFHWQTLFLAAHLKVGFGAWSAAEPMDTLVPVRSPGERQVSLVHVLALSQSHVAHHEQPRAVTGVAHRVLQAGSVGGGEAVNNALITL